MAKSDVASGDLSSSHNAKSSRRNPAIADLSSTQLGGAGLWRLAKRLRVVDRISVFHEERMAANINTRGRKKWAGDKEGLEGPSLT